MMSARDSVACSGRARLRIAGVLFLVSFLSYACFLQKPLNANVASRMFLTLSLVGHGEVTIDRYAAHTVDKAENSGHFYCDKAPGLSLLAVPTVAVVWPTLFSDSDPTDPETCSGYYLATYFATITTSGLITALSVAIVFLLAAELFGDLLCAILIAGIYGLATPAFGWATAFIGHAPAMGLLVIGFYCFHRLRRGTATTRRDLVLAAAGTACLAWAVVTEFTVAPLAATVLIAYGVSRIMPAKGDRAALIWCVLISGAACAAPLLVYDHVAFGAPWRVGYQSVAGFPGMKQGFMGIGTPSPSVLYEVIAGPRRGILYLCPILLLVPLGIARMAAHRPHRGIAILIGLVVIYYLLLNASYFYWDGGWSTGPRHITGMMPFACLALGAVWIQASRGMRVVMLVLAGVSAVLSLMCVTASMFAPPDYDNVLVEHVFTDFFGGTSRAFAAHLLGWRSRHVVLGVVLLWACAGLIVVRMADGARRADQTAGQPPESGGRRPDGLAASGTCVTP
jgi:hypothetical protein